MQISLNIGALFRLYFYLYFIVIRCMFTTAGPVLISITANKFRLCIRFGFRGFGISSSLVPEPGRRHFVHHFAHSSPCISKSSDWLVFQLIWCVKHSNLFPLVVITCHSRRRKMQNWRHNCQNVHHIGPSSWILKNFQISKESSIYSKNQNK